MREEITYIEVNALTKTPFWNIEKGLRTVANSWIFTMKKVFHMPSNQESEQKRRKRYHAKSRESKFFKDQLLKILLFAIPISAVLGGLINFELIITISLFQLTSILLIILAFFVTPGLPTTPIERTFLFFVMMFGLWGVTSLIWVENIQSGLKELRITLFVLVLCVAIIRTTRGSLPRFNSLIWGWVFGYIIAVYVGIWGVVTGSNLPSDYNNSVNAYLGTSAEFYFPASLFGNPNDFAGFLLISTPLTFFALMQLSSRLLPIKLMVVLVSVIMIWFTGSRSALVALAIMTTVVLFYLIRERHLRFLLAWTLPVLVLIVVAWVTLSGFTEIELGTSDRARLTFAEFGVSAFQESLGFGTGAGSIEDIARNQFPSGNYRSFSNLHNVFLEILVQYGFLIFIIFLFLITKIARKVTTNRAWDQNNEMSHFSLTTILLLIGLISWGFVSSSTLTSPVWILGIGTTVVLTAHLERNPRAKLIDNER